jgi:protein-tyrosine phosphatase
MRPPTWIDRGRLIAGRHPCSVGQEEAAREVRELLNLGVTLFLDLTEDGELEPYVQLVAPARYLRAPMRDFSVPADDVLVAAMDVIDTELERDGIVFVHCLAGCGRTGVVVGCWLVRHGMQPADALAQIAATRGLGCPQTLEQRLAILDWEAGR